MKTEKPHSHTFASQDPAPLGVQTSALQEEQLFATEDISCILDKT